MLNSTKTYLSFDLKDKARKPYKYCITGAIGECKVCNNLTNVITQGTDLFNESWIQYCMDHIKDICAKKQHCNICNKKASIADNTPKLCDKCYENLYNNWIEMNKICKYPVVNMNTCNCKFCNMR